MGGNLNLDLLIPEKFQKEQFPVFPTLLDELDDLIYGWVQEIQGLADLINPETVSNDYMQYLAQLLGTILSPQDTATETQRRDELRQAVDWIRMKGTYQSITVIEQMLSTNFSFSEMYTDDYVNFELVDPWFVAITEGQNPPGLGAGYYNSPHFGYQIKLNIKYDGTATWPNDYLYIPEWYQDISKLVERTRPIHTVPRYYVVLEPECDDDTAVMTVAGEIHSKIMSEWAETRLHFDDSNMFDDSDKWDQHDLSFYNGVTLWKIGDGSKGLQPDAGGWTDIENEVGDGTIDKTTILTDKVIWEFIVPAQVLNGISEIGLYSEGPETIRFAALFPDINLAGNINVRVIITVNRIT